MDTSLKNNIPWELIAESLTGSLPVDRELQLQQWISSDSENKGKYLQIKELWNNGMEDYKFYQMADPDASWNALHARLGITHSEKAEARVIRGQFNQRQKTLINLLAIAAVFIGFIGVGLYFILPKNKPVVYETAFNIQKKVSLPDGSEITLHPNTKIEVPHNFNRSGRTIIMDSGEAYFKVAHHRDKSFVVELGTTRIKDIGTSFTINKKVNRIDVSVSTGKVAFVKLSTKETKELNAGSGITFDVRTESFGAVRAVESVENAERLLVFENTPLSEVIVSIQKAFGGKIIINDHIAGKTFTGQLDGMPYQNVIKVICKSLGLDYAINDSICILKEKTIEQP